MTPKTHTPTPWHVAAIKGGRIVGDETAREYDKLHIHGTNATVATIYRGADARLIVAAVNERAALLAEHRLLREVLCGLLEYFDISEVEHAAKSQAGLSAVKHARAALAATEAP